MSKWKEQREAEQRALQELENTNAAKQKTPTLEEVEADFLDAFNTDNLKKTINANLAEQRKNEKKQMRDVGDTNYYFTVYFNNRDQLNEFCDRFGLDKELIHMDGREVARAFKRALRTPDVPNHKNRPTSKEYIELARNK